MEGRNIPLAAGLLMLPALVFQDALLPLALQVLFLIILQLVIGRKIRFLPNIIMLISITVLNLFQAHGRVLADVIGMQITQGALEIGLRRALMLIGLIYLSRFMVFRKPRFPGRIGRLLSLQFAFYEGFLSRRPSLKPQQIIEHLDKLLMEQEALAEEFETDSRAAREEQQRALLYVLPVILFWALFSVKFLELPF